MRLTDEQIKKQKEYLSTVPERVWIGAYGLTATETDLFDTIESQRLENLSLKSELSKWQKPYDQEMFDAAEKQASHKDSLAAQSVYITALEHALKHKQREILRKHI